MLMQVTPRSNSFASWLWAALLSVLFGTAVAAESAGVEEIVVVSLQGDVRVVMKGEARAVKVGATVELPASIRTGAGGAIELRQGRTTVGVAADTQLEIPATAIRGDLIERLIQSKGNVFYNVGKRTTKKLRVETPYLVAVVKGTQFNVAVQNDSSTISLFEGLLEVRASDDSDVVDLKAGEIAIRHGKDKNIRVLRMEEEKAGEVKQQESGERANFNPTTAGEGFAAGYAVDGSTHEAGSLDASLALAQNGDEDSDEKGSLDVSTQQLGLNKQIAALDTGIDLGSIGAGLGLDAGVNLSDGAVELGADVGVDVAGAGVDVGLDAGVDLGGGTVDLSADVGVDLGGTGVDLSLDAGADAGVDLGAGIVDVGADVGVSAGDLSADLGVDTGIDLGDGAVDLGVDAGVGGADIGVGADVDLADGSLGADVSVGGVDLGLDVDLNDGIDLSLGGETGTGADAGTSGSGSSGGGGVVGGLVGGLLGGLGR